MAEKDDKPSRDVDDPELGEALDAFELCQSARADNEKSYIEDYEFARLNKQWPDNVKNTREQEKRPVLTINRMPSFIRQVVNDSRQNRPQIKVKPVDSGADPETAKVLNGLIRNIEQQSKADIAYDTAIDSAVSGGFGYIRVDVDYSYDDSFDMDIKIERVANPLGVYEDPHATSADGSDWNMAFITSYLTRSEFEADYPDAEPVNWEHSEAFKGPWFQDKEILVAEYWKREKVKKTLLKLANGMAILEEKYAANQELFGGVQVLNSRPVDSYKVTHRIMNGAEILKKTEWAGCYIPIVPVYGEELNLEGKRYFRSLIRDAKDPQRMLNYWRSAATELVALAPRVPWIMHEDSFPDDQAEIAKWGTANIQSHPYLLYGGPAGGTAPVRQMLDTDRAIGSMSQALAAQDDMKAIMGMYDASLGQKSNETSGKAIMARQREGDISTFHFVDNLSRSIRQLGCIILDLIPRVYTGERVVRVLGEDGTPTPAKIGPQEAVQAQQMQMQAMEASGQEPPSDFLKMYDIATGKYDIAVDTGPAFTTRREEAAQQMIEFGRAAPRLFEVAGDILVKNLDWPQADELAERLKMIVPGGAGLPPEIKKMIEEGKKEIASLQAEIQKLKTDTQSDMMKAEVDRMKLSVEMEKLQIEKFKAETERMAVLKPEPAPVIQNTPQRAN